MGSEMCIRDSFQRVLQGRPLHRMLVANVHLPACGNYDVYEAAVDELKSTIWSAHSGSDVPRLCVAGDFNCNFEAHASESVGPVVKGAVHVDKSMLVLEMLSDFNLTLVNTFGDLSTDDVWTHRCPQGSLQQIDFVACNFSVSSMECKVVLGLHANSDHRPLLLLLSLIHI